MWRPRIPFMSRRVSGEDSPAQDTVPADVPADVPWWVPIFTDWGRPLAAVAVLVLCAPGEQHLAYLAGWNGDRAWLSWGWAGLLSLYAGISAVVATVRPRGARGKATAVMGAVLSLLLAMAAQPVSHMFTTGWLSAEPRPPLWLVVIVSGIPPFILGHLLHLAANPPRPRKDVPQPEDKSVPAATVTVLRPRTPRPRPVPAVSPRTSPAAVSRPVLSARTSQPVSLVHPSRPVPPPPVSVPPSPVSVPPPPVSRPVLGTSRPSMGARALSLLQDGLDEDTVADKLKAEYVSPDGTPPKANTIRKSITRARDKLSPRP